MYRKVEAFCLRQGFFPCRRLLIALSGGADSVSLLHIMKALQPKFGYSLSAMHINHMIRGEEAERDERFCRSLCAEMGIDFHCASIDIPTLSSSEHLGLEECARRYRYLALEAYADEIGADRIATAHTATDQLETVLMQLIRGSATAGGIRPMRGQIIRPLLEITRDEIVAYTAEHALSFVEDSTNADDRYTRNHIRHSILPAVKEINPSAESAFARFAEIRRRECDYLDAQALRELNMHSDAAVTTPVCLPVYADLKALQALDPVLRAHAIVKLFEKGGVTGLNHSHYEAIDALIVKGNSGASLSLPGHTVCKIENGRLCISAASAPASSNEIEPFELKIGENPLPDGAILFAYREINRGTEKYIKGKQNIYKLFINTTLDFGKISNVIRVRSRRSGDRILCGSIHRKLKKCFCDRHIPIEARPMQPILCDDDGIVWVPTLHMVRDGVAADATSESGQLLHLIYMADRSEDSSPAL